MKLTTKPPGEVMQAFFKALPKDQQFLLKELLTCSADDNEDYNDMLDKILNPPTREIRIKRNGEGKNVKIEFLSVHNQGAEEQVHNTWEIDSVIWLQKNWDLNWIFKATLPNSEIVKEAL